MSLSQGSWVVLVDSSDPIIKMYQNLIRGKLTEDLKISSKILSIEPKERYLELEKSLSKMEKKQISCMFSDLFVEFLQNNAYVLRRPLTSVLFMFFQASMSTLSFKKNRSENNPRKDIEEIDGITEDIFNSYAIFEVLDGHIGAKIEKKNNRENEAFT